MKLLYLILIFLCCSLFSNGQEPVEPYKSILLRGKATSFFIIEDIFWRNANIGMEFRLLDKHSFGIDYVFFRWRTEQDSLIDGMDSGQGFSNYRRREYLLFDYRYYPLTNRDWKVDPYVNILAKMGKQKIWTDNDETYFYPDDFNKLVLNQRSGFSEIGAAIGIRGRFSSSDRVGLDISLGLMKRNNTIYYERGYQVDKALDFETNEHQKNEKWLMHMRLNIYVKLFKLHF